MSLFTCQSILLSFSLALDHFHSVFLFLSLLASLALYIPRTQPFSLAVSFAFSHSCSQSLSLSAFRSRSPVSSHHLLLATTCLLSIVLLSTCATSLLTLKQVLNAFIPMALELCRHPPQNKKGLLEQGSDRLRKCHHLVQHMKRLPKGDFENLFFEKRLIIYFSKH